MSDCKADQHSVERIFMFLEIGKLSFAYHVIGRGFKYFEIILFGDVGKMSDVDVSEVHLPESCFD